MHFKIINRTPLATRRFVFECDPTGSQWTLKTPIEFEEITVPVGMITDFASVPRLFWNILPPFGTYLGPAVVHDYLYHSHIVTRKNADYAFLRAMTAIGVTKWKRWVMFYTVRLFGGKAYHAYD
jgi:hypothetical protein